MIENDSIDEEGSSLFEGLAASCITNAIFLASMQKPNREEESQSLKCPFRWQRNCL